MITESQLKTNASKDAISIAEKISGCVLSEEHKLGHDTYDFANKTRCDCLPYIESILLRYARLR